MTNRLTGRGVLLWLLAFFVPVFAINAYFIYASVSTFRGEDEQKPYLQGVEYNETLAHRAEQARLGWTATIGANRLPSGKVRVEVVLRQPNGRPAEPQRLDAQLRHPADETRDHELRLLAVGEGAYRGDVGNVSTGFWDVVVTSKQVPFEASRRLWVP